MPTLDIVVESIHRALSFPARTFAQSPRIRFGVSAPELLVWGGDSGVVLLGWRFRGGFLGCWFGWRLCAAILGSAAGSALR